MKITICDDSIEDLLHVEKLLKKYNNLYPNMELEIEKVSDSMKLYNKINAKEFSDIYILDMIMPIKTGIDIGTKIREAGEKSIIIYVTSSDDYAMDAYHIHAVRYLLKPVKEEKLFEAMDFAVSNIDRKKEAVFLLKTQNGLISIPHSRIEYIENAARIIYVHLIDGKVLKSVFIRKSFDEEIKELTDNRCFLQVHKSFVINMNYVENLSPNSIIMENGVNIPISKKRTSDVKKEYLLFITDRYRPGE